MISFRGGDISESGEMEREREREMYVYIYIYMYVLTCLCIYIYIYICTYGYFSLHAYKIVQLRGSIHDQAPCLLRYHMITLKSGQHAAFEGNTGNHFFRIKGLGPKP